MPSFDEDQLCNIFAEKVRASQPFLKWLLGRTKFASVASDSRLLWEEQKRRPAKAWWRHWWCNVKAVGRQSETDIFLAFAEGRKGMRFALHIENKVRSAFAAFQPEDYAARADQMRSNKWVPYSQFTTMLMAPAQFCNENSERCAIFDTIIPHEEIAAHIPQFHPS
ncbi:MAG: hypothetical protein ACHQAY_27025 [Hyphomicrobiales bacterium]